MGVIVYFLSVWLTAFMVSLHV